MIAKEALTKSNISITRHSGAGQSPVKTIVYWMLVGIYAQKGASMTMEGLNYSLSPQVCLVKT